mgnify:FL=1
MNFGQIPGNNNIKRQLSLAVAHDRISHAHLFCGDDGSSSLAMAWAFAKYLSCQDRQETDSCGQCSACLKHSKLSHPDVHWVFPVTTGRGTNPTSDMFIEDFRSFMLEQSFPYELDWNQKIGAANKQVFIGVKESSELAKKMILKPYEGSYRIVIIWQANKMHAPAANKLLKLLEEPPEKTIFILVSSEKDQLLETILSRVQSTDISAINDKEMDGFLANSFELEASKRERIMLLSSGNLGQAIKMCQDQDRSISLAPLFQSWMRISYAAKIPDLGRWIDSFVKLGREEQKEFIQYSLHMVRECLVYNFGTSQLQRLNDQELSFCRKFAPFINENNAENIIEELELAFRHLTRNANTKIVFMDLSLRLVLLLRTKSLTLKKTIN